MVALRTVRQREGIYFNCDQCGGRAVTIPQIRRFTGDRFAVKMMVQIKRATETSKLSCPFCYSPMKQFQIPQPAITLDACKPCGTVWFVAGEFEELPEGVIESQDELRLRGMEAFGKWKLEELAERQEQEEGIIGEPPDEAWKWVPALVGLPVKIDNDELSRLPWMTWSLSAIIAIVSICAFSDLDNVINHFGMIPAEVWRYGGLTLLTEFFIHGGVLHLVGNLYFFILFGGSVEDYLGRWRFLGLILLSTLVGNGFHILANPHSTDPCIGASGGISGVLIFYALEFPRALMGLCSYRYLRWIYLPAWAWFLYWFSFQCIGIYMQIRGYSHVSSLAHLGGVTTGFILWLWWRRIGLQTGQTETT
jgi:membrane associated rhomboid family serine protease/Zn-finger nucleic acid-binding protein